MENAMEGVARDEREPELSSDAVVQSTPRSLPLQFLHYFGNELMVASSFFQGVIFWLRYNWGSYNPTILDRCIACWKRALQLRTQGHFGRHVIANSLGTAFSAHFDYSANLDDLDSSVKSFNVALEQCPLGHRSRALCLNNLASSLKCRYSQRRDVADINLSIELLIESLELSPPECSIALATKIYRFFRRLGAAGFLDGRALSLSNLGDALLERYKRSDSDPDDIRRAINIQREALELCTASHPRAEVLVSLAASFVARFGKEGDATDIQHAIELFEEAFVLFPLGHPNATICLKNLATAYLHRHQQFGKIEDIQKAMDLFARVMALRPSGHPKHYLVLDAYADAYFLRYQALGDVSDLQSSIRMYNEAAELVLPNQNLRAGILLSLSAALQLRLSQFGILDDLRRAVQLSRRAMDLLPPGHSDRVFCLVFLADTELLGYNKFGDIEYLERAIQRHSEAKELLSANHPLRGYALNRSALAFTARFELLDDTEDLHNAIKLHAESLALSPPGHHWRGIAQSDLADALLMRYKRLEEIADVEQVIALQRRLLAETWPSPHPSRSTALRDLANALLELYQHFQRRVTLDEAMENFSAAATYPYSSARIRIAYCQEWLNASHAYSLPDQASLAYPLALDLLPRMLEYFAHLPVDSRGRVGRMKTVRNLPGDSAIHALLYFGGPKKAVEWIEQARAMFWNQRLKLRTPFDGLPESLQQKFKQTVRLLESDSEPDNRPKGLERHKWDQWDGKTSFVRERETDRQRELVDEFDELVKQARQIEGFEHLLMPKTYEEISSVAKHGPVVILLASAIGGCAGVLIRSDSREAVHVALPGVTVESLEDLGRRSTRAANDSRGMTEFGVAQIDDGTRKMSKAKGSAPKIDQFDSVLEELWRNVVAPVIQSLGVEKSSDMSKRPRLWWCATGPFTFLPMHAAGVRFHRADRECTSDYVVSSYTPTLRVLLDAQDTVSRRAVVTTKALLLAQPSTPGLPHLPSTLREIDMLSHLFPDDALLRLRSDPSLSFTESNSSVTVSEAVEKIPDASILHLACHGKQDKHDPVDSGFALQDGILSVERLVNLKTPHAFFAFLSACETASGDHAQPDESIHLAAAMLFAGFQSVVATMWPMHDSDGPEIARNVYQRMLQAGGSSINPDAIAYALDEGVRMLRDRNLPPSRWACYIHMGV